MVFDRLRAADPENQIAAAWQRLGPTPTLCQAPDRDHAHRVLGDLDEQVVAVLVPELTGSRGRP